MKSKEYTQFLRENQQAKSELNLQVGDRFNTRDYFARLHVVVVERATPHGLEISINGTTKPEWRTNFRGIKEGIRREKQYQEKIIQKA